MSQLSGEIETSIAPSAAPPAACLNCGAELAGEYCHGCGQHATISRLDLRHLREEFARQALSLDRGLLLTARELCTDPGGVIRRYLAGQRRRYASPVTYLFVGTALSLLALKMYEKRFYAWTRAAMAQAIERNPNTMTPAEATAFFEIVFGVSKQVTVSTLGAAIPFALLLRWLFRREGLNLAEAGVFTLFTFGHGLVLHSLLAPLLLLLRAGDRGWQIFSGGAVVFMALICGCAAFGLFDRRWSAALRTTLALVVGWTLYTVLVGLGAVAYALLAF